MEFPACEEAMEVLPTMNDLIRWNVMNHDHCAVVGPSQRLLHRKYGEKIDKHDIIIRVNDAPTEVRSYCTYFLLKLVLLSASSLARMIMRYNCICILSLNILMTFLSDVRRAYITLLLQGFELHVGSRTDIRIVNHFNSPMEAKNITRLAQFLVQATNYTIFVEPSHREQPTGDFHHLIANAMILKGIGVNRKDDVATLSSPPRVLFSPTATGYGAIAQKVARNGNSMAFRSNGLTAV